MISIFQEGGVWRDPSSSPGSSSNGTDAGSVNSTAPICRCPSQRFLHSGEADMALELTLFIALVIRFP